MARPNDDVRQLSSLLGEASAAVVTAASADELFERVCAAIASHGNYSVVAVLLADPTRERLQLRTAAGPSAAQIAGLELGVAPPTPGADGLSARAFRQGMTVVDNHSSDAPFEALHAPRGTAQIASAVSLPLRREGVVVGILSMAAAEPERFDPDVVALLERVALQVSFGLDHFARAAALRASEERYRQLVDNIEELVATTDVEGRYTFVNRAIQRFGMQPEALVGRRFEAHIDIDNLAASEAAWRGALAGGATSYDARFIDDEGHTHFLRTRARPLWEDGRVVGVQTVATDRTREHEIGVELRLAQKMEAVGRLAGGVAHDFRNLILVISSYIDLALERTGLDDPLRANLEDVRDASQRAADLTRQLLAFSRKQVLRPRVVALDALVTRMAPLLRPLLGEDVALSVDAPADGGDIAVDPGQIEQVIMNLAVNARDAMPRGGTLSLATGRALLGSAEARSFEVPPGEYVVLAVSDTGSGMSAEVRSHLFEPFFTTKEPGRGTGLGLATVYGIVRQSGGGIRVESELGAGTRFDIALPPAFAARAEAQAVTPGERALGAGETILLAEDDAAVRRATTRMLEAAGYRVLAAADGNAALALFTRHGDDVALLLTDVVMPGMSGLELAARVRALRPAVPALFMSGYRGEALAERGARELPTPLLVKPFPAAVLLARVEHLLRDPR